jgi:hypothetical protein
MANPFYKEQVLNNPEYMGEVAKKPPNNTVEHSQASFCGNWSKCDFPGYRKCNKQCGNYTPTG